MWLKAGSNPYRSTGHGSYRAKSTCCTPIIVALSIIMLSIVCQRCMPRPCRIFHPELLFVGVGEAWQKQAARNVGNLAQEITAAPMLFLHAHVLAVCSQYGSSASS